VFVLVEMHAFLNFTTGLLGRGICDLNPASSLFKIKFLFKNLKFYGANRCVTRRHKSKNWSEWTSFEKSCRPNALEYKVPSVVKVDRRIRWHYTTTILRLRIGARLTRYRNCNFHNGCRTISRHADGISRYSVPPSAGPLLPLPKSHHDATLPLPSPPFPFSSLLSSPSPF